MKTLIIYGSTYGFTKECVTKLKEQIKGEVTVVNIMTDGEPSIDEYDNIIIGGSIYIGQIQKNVKNYCIANINKIKNKKLALFLSCGLPENFEENLKNSFPDELIKKAVAKECFGGELRIEKMKFSHKMITKMMTKSTAKEGKQPPKQIPENIAKIASVINK